METDNNLDQSENNLENTSFQIVDNPEDNFTNEINAEYKHKTHRLQKEKYRILKEAQDWQDAAYYWKSEADKLHRYATDSSDAALAQADQNVYHIIEQARENKRRALEEGDTDLAVQADFDLSTAVARLETIKNKQTERDYEKQKYLNAIEEAEIAKQYQYSAPPIAQYTPEVDVPVEAEYLVKANPWMNPARPEYDPNKVNTLYQFTKELDENLYRQGRGHEYFSPAYISEVNNFIRSNFSDSDSNRSNSNNKSNYNNVSPVSRGNSSYSNSKPKERYVLTEDEKFMARNAGLSEESWLKHKIEDMKKRGDRNTYGQ